MDTATALLNISYWILLLKEMAALPSNQSEKCGNRCVQKFQQLQFTREGGFKPFPMNTSFSLLFVSI